MTKLINHYIMSPYFKGRVRFPAGGYSPLTSYMLMSPKHKIEV